LANATRGARGKGEIEARLPGLYDRLKGLTSLSAERRSRAPDQVGPAGDAGATAGKANWLRSGKT